MANEIKTERDYYIAIIQAEINDMKVTAEYSATTKAAMAALEFCIKRIQAAPQFRKVKAIR